MMMLQPEFTQAEPRALRVVPPTIALLRSCSWAAEKLFRRNGSLRTMVWLTEDAGGRREQFETACHGPLELSDDAVLGALVEELREDFGRAGVVRFSVAYPGEAVDFVAAGPLCRPEQRRREVIGFEAHNIDDVHIGAHREIIRSPGRPPVLGALSPLERLSSSRYATLL
jgi:hypothetical protein